MTFPQRLVIQSGFSLLAGATFDSLVVAVVLTLLFWIALEVTS